ncbi:ARM repeat superfamily protein isoform 1 [Hibiscus syriacus]|uniref:ARM repeat superfamily protein isoform 1 n=1 Tax=Hibiscus syriacus TaxID=106335 RepID=A0A6A3D4J0_HIBSY|nr:blue copper protein 1b-like [Hibiscus syriacus]KAE8734788.1 ARM repeat superfamily protein isoform 1 [Hibiscus syriacus]
MGPSSGYYTTSVLQFFAIVSCLLVLSFSGSATAYKNYTVGGSLGWFDALEKPDVDYQKWADSKNFSLGDFLIFNTDNNHSIIQTYNLTTYKLCDYNDALQNDTIQWSAADPSSTAPHPISVAVPLLKEGMTYFFSGDYDGEQCNNGQRFKVNVTHGQGLPKSLQDPPDDAPAPNSPDFGSDDSAPETIVPANFNHPIEEDSDKDEASGSGSISFGGKFNGFLMLLQIVCIFLKF